MRLPVVYGYGRDDGGDGNADGRDGRDGFEGRAPQCGGAPGAPTGIINSPHPAAA
jgi:hypothetical protein